LSASSGVIVPLARPRMPSVPKYLRTKLYVLSYTRLQAAQPTIGGP
jgi:hypothetical protein